MDLHTWTPRPFPPPIILEGRYVRLEPLDIEKHGDNLYAALSTPDNAERFKYVLAEPPKSREDFQTSLEANTTLKDTLFFVVFDKESGLIGGRMAYRFVEPDHGTAFIGVFWNNLVARKPAATETFYLMAKYLFDDLGYRRLSWRCRDENEASKKAALRFGFTYEGHLPKLIFTKGKHIVSCLFSMIDKEWPLNKQALQEWLDPKNFDENGIQRERLVDIRDHISKRLGGIEK